VGSNPLKKNLSKKGKKEFYPKRKRARVSLWRGVLKVEERNRSINYPPNSEFSLCSFFPFFKRVLSLSSSELSVSPWLVIISRVFYMQCYYFYKPFALCISISLPNLIFFFSNGSLEKEEKRKKKLSPRKEEKTTSHQLNPLSNMLDTVSPAFKIPKLLSSTLSFSWSTLPAPSYSLFPSIRSSGFPTMHLIQIRIKATVNISSRD